MSVCVIALEDEDGSRLVFGRKHREKGFNTWSTAVPILPCTGRKVICHFLFKRKVVVMGPRPHTDLLQTVKLLEGILRQTVCCSPGPVLALNRVLDLD